MCFVDSMSAEEKDDFKKRIAKVLSEILSDKYECKVTLRFVPKPDQE